MSFVSERVLAKARRLLDENRVSQGIFYRVEGDNGTYSVYTDADPLEKTASWAECTCQANAAYCSHVAAVLLLVLESRPIPVDELGDYVHLEVVDDG